MANLTTLNIIPTVFGNTALDVAVLVLVSLTLIRYITRSSKTISEASKTRTRANTLRKTLELKADEVAALRRSLAEARKDTQSQITPYLEEIEARAALAQVGSTRERDPKHEELEKQLEEASKRHPRQL